MCLRHASLCCQYGFTLCRAIIVANERQTDEHIVSSGKPALDTTDDPGGKEILGSGIGLFQNDEEAGACEENKENSTDGICKVRYLRERSRGERADTNLELTGARTPKYGCRKMSARQK